MCLGALALLAGCPPMTEVVPAPAGDVVGLVEGRNEPVEVFRGIPYAQPPVGDLRWRAPEPVEPWEGTLQAVAFGPQCVQGNGGGNASEDCLFLNIWRPTGPIAEPLPVMVWIHGGSYTNGDGGQRFDRRPHRIGQARAQIGAEGHGIGSHGGILGAVGLHDQALLDGVPGFVAKDSHARGLAAAFDLQHLFSLQPFQAGMGQVKRDRNARHAVGREPLVGKPDVGTEQDILALQLFVELLDPFDQPAPTHHRI